LISYYVLHDRNLLRAFSCLAGALFLRPQSPFPDHGPGVPFTAVCLCADVDPGKSVKEPERVQEPQYDADDHYGVQDRLDSSLHRDEAIHEPQQYAHNDQGQQNLRERHIFLPSCSGCETLSVMPAFSACDPL
jgi:hypothetical protein